MFDSIENDVAFRALIRLLVKKRIIRDEDEFNDAVVDLIEEDAINAERSDEDER